MKHRRQGQALAEFALVAPIFFLLLLGIIEAGRFIFYYETLNNATREGARYAIVNGERSLTCSTGPDAGTSTTSCDPTGEDVVERVRNAASGMDRSAVSVDRCWWYTQCAFKADADGDTTPNYLDGDWAPTHGDGNYLRGATVTVRATYTYSPIFGSVLGPILPSITVTAESSLVVNN